MSGIIEAQALPAILPEPKQRSTLGRLFRRYPMAMIGGGLLLLMVLIAVFAPVLFTVDPTAISPPQRLRPPSDAHWFGTDLNGRDVYSRAVYGTRVSLLVGISVALLSCVLGTLLGLVSGTIRWLDGILMRAMDGLMSIPSVLLAISFTSLLRGSVAIVVVAISIAELPRVARLVRGLVLGLRDQAYVEAAIACGTPMPTIMRRHILPNALAPLVVQATYVCASAMITEAILGFIGAGVPPNIPSWGNIIAECGAVFQVKPYLVFFPAAFLSLTVLAVNMLGDGLRDALDPRLAKRL